MRKLPSLSLALVFLSSARVGAGDGGKDNDWPQWRGPERNAICTEKGLLKAWPKEGPRLLWDSKKVAGGKSVGKGYSSVSIAKGKLFTMGAIADAEKKTAEFVFCLDPDTGKELWRTKLGPSKGDGPRCTPTVDGDRVYALTRLGVLGCLKTGDGSILWHKDFASDFGGHIMSNWDFSESPTVDGDKLVCTPGGKTAALVALNKLTGAVLWKCATPQDAGAGYASIVSVEAGGIKQYVTLLGPKLGLVGVDANTGKFLWNYRKVANGTANISTSLVQGDFVFASTGYGTGAVLLSLMSDGKDGIKVKEDYFKAGKVLQNHHGGMVMIGDYIYGGHGHNDGQPFCLEWKTGKFAWGPVEGAGTGSAAVLYADGNLYFRYQSGEMALIEASPKGYKLISSFRVPTTGNGSPHPVIYHGKLYLRGNDQILCYDIKAK